MCSNKGYYSAARYNYCSALADSVLAFTFYRNRIRLHLEKLIDHGGCGIVDESVHQDERGNDSSQVELDSLHQRLGLRGEQAVNVQNIIYRISTIIASHHLIVNRLLMLR